MEFQANNSFIPSPEWGCPKQDFLFGASSASSLPWAASPQQQPSLPLSEDCEMSVSPLHTTSETDFVTDAALETLFANNLVSTDGLYDLILSEQNEFLPQLAPEDLQETLQPPQPTITIKTKRVKPSSGDYLKPSPTQPSPQQISCVSPTSSVPDALVTLKDIFGSEESTEIFETLLQSDSSLSGCDSSAPSSPNTFICASPVSFYELSPSTAGPHKEAKRGRGRCKAASRVDMYERKKEQNKQAATRYRQKKKQEEDAMLAELATEEVTNKSLRKELTNTRQELKFLRRLMKNALITKGIISAEMLQCKSLTQQPSGSAYLPSS